MDISSLLWPASEGLSDRGIRTYVCTYCKEGERQWEPGNSLSICEACGYENAQNFEKFIQLEENVESLLLDLAEVLARGEPMEISSLSDKFTEGVPGLSILGTCHFLRFRWRLMRAKFFLLSGEVQKAENEWLGIVNGDN